MHRAFDTLFHHTAGNLIGIVDIPVVVVIVGIATTRANEFCEAITAFFTGEQARVFELFTDIRAHNPLGYAAHTEFVVSDKLMAGVQIAVRGNGEILVAGTARGNTLRKTRPAFQIHVKMEEVKPFPFGIAL